MQIDAQNCFPAVKDSHDCAILWSAHRCVAILVESIILTNWRAELRQKIQAGEIPGVFASLISTGSMKGTGSVAYLDGRQQE